MRQTKLTDNTFNERFDVIDRKTVDDVVNASRGDVRRAVHELTELRERIRDDELRRLEQETETLLDQVESVERKKLVEELRCFRDVLAIYRDGPNDSE